MEPAHGHRPAGAGLTPGNAVVTNLRTPVLPAAWRETSASRPARAASPTAGADPAGFASLLRQTQAAPSSTRPAPQPPPPPPPAPAGLASNLESGTAGARAAAPKPTSAPTSVPVDVAAAARERGPQPRSDANDDNTDSPDPADTRGTHPAPTPHVRARASMAGKPPAADHAGSAVAGTGAEAERSGSPLDTAAGGTASQALVSAGDALPAPSLPPWLAMLRPGTAPGDAGAETTASSGDAAGTPTASCGTGVAAAKPAAAVKADASAQHKAAADDALAGATADATADAKADAKADGGRFAQALDEQQAVAQAAAQSVAAGRDVAANSVDPASIAAAFAPNPATGFSPAAPVALALATPVTAPAFGQELGVRISVLTRDGVQHAELHLNPPDMGPVSVQIVLDGTQAQVDFGADVAATRAALEAGLPALASALRDVGFTLTGGGVSQHSRNRGDGSGAAGGSEGKPNRASLHRAEGSAADEALGGVRRTGRRTASLGGLDLYA